MNETPNPGPISLVIVRRVKPGCEAAFLEWLAGITEVMRTFPGFQGSQLLPPVPGVQPEYVLLLHFEDQAAFERWHTSDVRRAWVEKSASFTEQLVHVQPVAGLQGLFVAPESTVTLAPPKWKMALAVTLGLYPLIVLSAQLLVPYLELPFLLRTLVTTALNVLLMTYLVMPALTWLLRDWLMPHTE